jgi:hypothetical protein
MLVGLVTVAAAAPRSAPARDDGRYEAAPAHIKTWFRSLKSPKGAAPCCDEADGHRTEYQVRGGAYWVPVEGNGTRSPRRSSSGTMATRPEKASSSTI